MLRGELRLTDIRYTRSVSYSQFGEGMWLAEYFADKSDGFYVDVGAYDPFNASNTLLLYRRGWSGINIEPDPAALARLRRSRRRDTNLGLVISDVSGDAFFLLDGSFSTIETPAHKAPGASNRIVGRTHRLEEVLAEWTHGTWSWPKSILTRHPSWNRSWRALRTDASRAPSDLYVRTCARFGSRTRTPGYFSTTLPMKFARAVSPLERVARIHEVRRARLLSALKGIRMQAGEYETVAPSG